MKLAQFKPLAIRRPSKDEREKQVLLGLVSLYLSLGKPVGSNTLRENGFAHLSSATIRNYFSKLEAEGLLKQQHSSGGRIPTQEAFKLYAENALSPLHLSEKEKELLRQKLYRESKEIASYLQGAAETISDITHCALFLSAPRFDQDFILDIKLISIDQNRCLCILITDFGLVHTETLYTERRLSSFAIKRIESYFQWRLRGIDKPQLEEEEETIAKQFYNELLLRHIVNYTNFSSEDIYKTGFSKLLSYEDFNDASTLAGGLSLFENLNGLRSLLKECTASGRLKFWIGDDLSSFSPGITSCSVIAAPYFINQTVAGAVAILGPHRLPYEQLFATLHTATEWISQSLTKSLYKYKISFRRPENHLALEPHQCLLLENKCIR